MNIETTCSELNQHLASNDAETIISTLLEHAGNRALVSTNFRPGEAVLLHLITRQRPNIPVLWVDHGYNTPETYRFAETLIRQLDLNIHLYLPRRSRAHREAINGPTPSIDAETAHQAFTHEVKLEPFARGLRELDPLVWFTALRRSQTELRAGLEIASPHGAVLKTAPLLDWSDNDMQHYLDTHQLPDETRYTDPTKVEEKRECGLHLGPVEVKG